ncbi:HAD family hydrolase [Paenirhodobacter sp.]|uniref:HAD family hydrolase n=1 Tax=Paenirhodobacter sp. TaxID=1965326 RepID=UPI003B410F87
MKPQAVLFDCDGVLVDSEPVTFGLIQEEFAAHGLSMTIAELEPLFLGHTIAETGAYARAKGADLPADWADTFYARMCARLAEGTALMPGVPELLDRLDATGVPYAVGSNGRRMKMEATLGQHPAIWAKLKDRLFSGQDLGCPKPAPDLYLIAARSLGADPAHCVVMEDTATGARAGVAAGMRVLGYAPQGASPALAGVGAEIVGSMFDVPGLLGI